VPDFDRGWDERQMSWDDQHFFLENTLFFGTRVPLPWDERHTTWDERHISINRSSERPRNDPLSPRILLFGSSLGPRKDLEKTSEPEEAMKFNKGNIKVASG
jgi:hypothetical protein